MSESLEMPNDVRLKCAALNCAGLNTIHDSIQFKNGKLTIQLQVGHPTQEGAISGCFSTHAVEAIIKLHEHYQEILPSLEMRLAIKALNDALHWLDSRAKDC